MIRMPIRSYADKRTADFVAGKRIKDFQAFEHQRPMARMLPLGVRGRCGGA
jgi:hypothetical protein